MAILKVRDAEGKVYEILALKGDPGYTPQKSIDYWTEEDKAEMLATLKKHMNSELETISLEKTFAKNLFNKNDYKSVEGYIDSSEMIVKSSEGTTTVYIPIEANQTYTVSKIASERFIIGVSDSEVIERQTPFTHVVAKNSNTSLTITTGENNKTLAVFCHFTSVDSLSLEEILDTLQIEKGDTATEYEAWHEPTYNAIDEEARMTASEASQIAGDTRNSILDDISTSSFSLKELRDIDTLKKDTEFISVMNEGTFKSQSAENEKTSIVLYKNKEVIRSTTTLDNLTSEFRRAFPTGGFLDILGTQEFDIIVYIEDVTKISKIELKLQTYIDADRNVTQTKTANQLHNGWNYLRFLTTNLPLEQWGKCKMLRVLTYTTEPTTVYYGDIIQVKPNKARIMFVDDHAYSDFKTNAYPVLKNQGIPVTWAIQPGRIGLSIADSGTLLTEEDITELSNDPYSEFSWHSYDGTDTSSMSITELQADCKKSITFLRKNGLLPEHYWRAAWKHNNAPNARYCDDLMDGGAYYDTIGRPEVFPFTNKYNISRYSIHRRTQEDIDSIFNILQKTHCTVVFYTHGFITVADDSESNTTNNVTNIEFDYFMSNIATGVSEGWIEGTTFDWLMRKYSIVEF